MYDILSTLKKWLKLYTMGLNKNSFTIYNNNLGDNKRFPIIKVNILEIEILN